MSHNEVGFQAWLKNILTSFKTTPSSVRARFQRASVRGVRLIGGIYHGVETDDIADDIVRILKAN